jgi:DNA (cytosine-5)-methyltransferase 1
MPSTAYLLGQHTNSVARDVTKRPTPTVATSGKIQLCSADPCLVKYYGTSPPQPVDSPLDTVAAKGHKYALSSAESILLRQQDGGKPWSVSDRPVPTIATKGGHAIATPMTPLIEPKNGINGGTLSNVPYPAHGQPFHTLIADPRAKLVSPSLVRYSHGGAALDVNDPMPTIATEKGGVFSLSDPYLAPLYNPSGSQRPRTRSIDRPLMTATASKSPAAVTTPLVRPFLDDCQGPAQGVDTPLKTQPASDRYALCVPELWPWGLDVRYRMLQPRELQQAQGFPPEYEIVGTKEDRTEQIGNAVPVNLATALCKHVLTAEEPSLASFGGGITAEEDAEIRDYEEVVGDD